MTDKSDAAPKPLRAKLFAVEPGGPAPICVGIFAVATYKIGQVLQVADGLGGASEISAVSEGPATIVCERFQPIDNANLAALLESGQPLEIEIVVSLGGGKRETEAKFAAVEPVESAGRNVVFRGTRVAH
jgi:hypothetical protein